MGNDHASPQSHTRFPNTCPASTISAEIWLEILERLPPSTLTRSAAPTCRVLHSLSITVLYRHLDFGVQGHLPTAEGCLPVDWFGRAINQYRLIGQLITNPEYAQHARRLTWSTHLFTYCQDLLQRRSFPQQQMDVLHLLVNVRYVDLHTGSRGFGATPKVPSLFPKATRVRLGGVMHYNLASAILHGAEKVRLEHLTLDNVLEYEEEIYTRDDGMKMRTGPSAKFMLPLLNPELQARCHGLKSLSLYKQGEQHFLQNWHMWLPDEEVYVEWAEFISTVQPQHLRIKHGGSTFPPWNGEIDRRACRSRSPSPRILPPQSIAPMDEKFSRIIAPVLRNGWTGLKHVELQGICFGVAGRVLATLTQNMPHVAVLHDQTVEWCWNGEIKQRHYNAPTPAVSSALPLTFHPIDISLIVSPYLAD